MIKSRKNVLEKLFEIVTNDKEATEPDEEDPN